MGLGFSLDQAPDDLHSLTYTTGHLEEDIEITGSPEVILYVSLETGSEMNLIAKLNDVRPDGSSVLITSGLLKGSHFCSHERPQSLESGEVHKFQIPLWATSYLVQKGHKLRLSVSCSDFPRIWPTRISPQIRLCFGGEHASSLRLPLVQKSTDPSPAPTIRRPDYSVNRFPFVVEASPQWKIEQDLATGTLSVNIGLSQQIHNPSGVKFRIDHTASATVAVSRPEDAKLEVETLCDLEYPSLGRVQVESRTLATQTSTLLTGKVLVEGHLFFESRWYK